MADDFCFDGPDFIEKAKRELRLLEEAEAMASGRALEASEAATIEQRTEFAQAAAEKRVAKIEAARRPKPAENLLELGPGFSTHEPESWGNVSKRLAGLGRFDPNTGVLRSRHLATIDSPVVGDDSAGIIREMSLLVETKGKGKKAKSVAIRSDKEPLLVGFNDEGEWGAGLYLAARWGESADEGRRLGHKRVVEVALHGTFADISDPAMWGVLPTEEVDGKTVARSMARMREVAANRAALSGFDGAFSVGADAEPSLVVWNRRAVLRYAGQQINPTPPPPVGRGLSDLATEVQEGTRRPRSTLRLKARNLAEANAEIEGLINRGVSAGRLVQLHDGSFIVDSARWSPDYPLSHIIGLPLAEESAFYGPAFDDFISFRRSLRAARAREQSGAGGTYFDWSQEAMTAMDEGVGGVMASRFRSVAERDLTDAEKAAAEARKVLLHGAFTAESESRQMSLADIRQLSEEVALMRGLQAGSRPHGSTTTSVSPEDVKAAVDLMAGKPEGFDFVMDTVRENYPNSPGLWAAAAEELELVLDVHGVSPFTSRVQQVAEEMAKAVLDSEKVDLHSGVFYAKAYNKVIGAGFEGRLTVPNTWYDWYTSIGALGTRMIKNIDAPQGALEEIYRGLTGEVRKKLEPKVAAFYDGLENMYEAVVGQPWMSAVRRTLDTQFFPSVPRELRQMVRDSIFALDSKLFGESRHIQKQFDQLLALLGDKAKDVGEGEISPVMRLLGEMLESGYAGVDEHGLRSPILEVDDLAEALRGMGDTSEPFIDVAGNRLTNVALSDREQQLMVGVTSYMRDMTQRWATWEYEHGYMGKELIEAYMHRSLHPDSRMTGVAMSTLGDNTILPIDNIQAASPASLRRGMSAMKVDEISNMLGRALFIDPITAFINRGHIHYRLRAFDEWKQLWLHTVGARMDKPDAIEALGKMVLNAPNKPLAERFGVVDTQAFAALRHRRLQVQRLARHIEEGVYSGEPVRDLLAEMSDAVRNGEKSFVMPDIEDYQFNTDPKTGIVTIRSKGILMKGRKFDLAGDTGPLLERSGKPTVMLNGVEFAAEDVGFYAFSPRGSREAVSVEGVAGGAPAWDRAARITGWDLQLLDAQNALARSDAGDQVFAIPHDAARVYETMFSTIDPVYDDIAGPFMQHWQQMLRFWKANVTINAFNVPFHLRNQMGNMMLMKIAGMPADEAFRTIGEVRTLLRNDGLGFIEELLATTGPQAKLFLSERAKMGSAFGVDTTPRFFEGMTFYPEGVDGAGLVEWAYEDGIIGTLGGGFRGGDVLWSQHEKMQRDGALSIFRKLTGTTTRNYYTMLGGHIAQSIEDSSRMSLYLWALRNGHTRTSASKMVRLHLFNYHELTTAERAIRRNAIPFWSWYRKNMPLQMVASFKSGGIYPAKMMAYNQWVNQGVLHQGDRDPNKLLPPWSSDVPTKFINPHDDVFFAYSNLSPFEDLAFIGDYILGVNERLARQEGNTVWDKIAAMATQAGETAVETLVEMIFPQVMGLAGTLLGTERPFFEDGQLINPVRDPVSGRWSKFGTMARMFTEELPIVRHTKRMWKLVGELELAAHDELGEDWSTEYFEGPEGFLGQPGRVAHTLAEGIRNPATQPIIARHAFGFLIGMRSYDFDPDEQYSWRKASIESQVRRNRRQVRQAEVVIAAIDSLEPALQNLPANREMREKAVRLMDYLRPRTDILTRELDVLTHIHSVYMEDKELWDEVREQSLGMERFQRPIQ